MASRQRRLQLLSNLEKKYALPRGILYGVWGAESGFAEHGGSTSGAGAQGPFQFMPSTAAGMGVNPQNFGSSAKGAARYLSNYKDRGTPGMLAAYNAGPAGNPNNPETQAYIPRVTGLARDAPYLGAAPTPQRAQPKIGPLTRGPISWYGGPNDAQDNNIPALPGATNKVPGIALYNRDTLGHWFRVRGPNGRVMIVQQTDIGPAPWTGKRIDFNAALVRALGYTEGNFPTGAIGGARYLGKEKPSENGGGGGGGSRSIKLPDTLRLVERRVFDSAGFERATRAFQLGEILRNRPQSPFTSIGAEPRGGLSSSNPLLAVLPTTPPDPVAYQEAISSLERIAGKRIRFDVPRRTQGAPEASTTRGKAIVAAGADRAGVSTDKRITDFVSLIAGSIGRPITITTGTNHSQMTTSGNVSDHWEGDAADIGMAANGGSDDSREGDMIAGRALMLAGVPRLKARQMAQQGGLYNLYPRSGPLKGMRLQVIWGVDGAQNGGNHHNHVHLGIRPA